MKTILFIAILAISACSAPPSEEIDNRPALMAQDVESCTNDALTPWCLSACEQASYTWCAK